MQAAIWPACLAGDIAAIDRVIAIMRRRAQMLGLDRQPSFGYGREEGEADGERVVRVEIVGNPEPERMKFLEQERERLLALTEGSAPPRTTIN